MEAKTITLEEFKVKSKAKGSIAFKKAFENEAMDLIAENKDSCVSACSLSEAMENYTGKSKAQPSKIVATFFIHCLKKAGYKDATLGRVSVNNAMVNLRL